MTATLAQLAAAHQAPDVNDLTDLVRTLNAVAGELQSTHAALQAQVAQLKSELAEANAQLRRSQALAALGEMAAGIAHEVRNPLGSIQLNVQLLASELDAKPQQAELCTKVSQAVEGIDAIVRDVLTFAREMRIRPEPLGAGDLFERALDACESLVRRSGIDVQTRSGAADEDVIEGDGLLLTQALGNVVRNAVEAIVESAPESRIVRLSAAVEQRRGAESKRAEHLVITVEDSGPGIPADIEDRIFNPFFTTRSTGTGLGLAMVHRIVEAHHGHVTLGKSALGGAKVELCLPRRGVSARAGIAVIETNGRRRTDAKRRASATNSRQPTANSQELLTRKRT
jgi:two-component system sensor histidine kinase HydH